MSFCYPVVAGMFLDLDNQHNKGGRREMATGARTGQTSIVHILRRRKQLLHESTTDA